MLELDEAESGLDDVAGLAGAEHGALERPLALALGHQGEAPLAQAAQQAQQRVAGPGIEIELFVTWRGDNPVRDLARGNVR